MQTNASRYLARDIQSSKIIQAGTCTWVLNLLTALIQTGSTEIGTTWVGLIHAGMVQAGAVLCFQEERMVDAPNGSVQHVEKAGLIPKYINKKVGFHAKGLKNS